MEFTSSSGSSSSSVGGLVLSSCLGFIINLSPGSRPFPTEHEKYFSMHSGKSIFLMDQDPKLGSKITI